MCLQLHEIQVFLQFSPCFLQKISTFHLFCFIPKDVWNRKSYPPQTLVLGGASSVWRVRPVAWCEPLQDEFLLGAVPLLEIHFSSIFSFMTVCSKKHIAMESPSVDVFPRSFPLYHKVCALCWVSRASPAGRLRPLAYAALAKQPAKDRLSLPILGLQWLRAGLQPSWTFYILVTKPW